MRWHCPPDTWFEIEPCWSAAKHVISRSCRLPTIFNLYDWAGRKHFVLWNLECQSRRRICDLWLSKQAPGPRPAPATYNGGSRMCKRRGRKPHFGWKKIVSFTLCKTNAWKCNILTNRGYALCWIRHWHIYKHITWLLISKWCAMYSCWYL